MKFLGKAIFATVLGGWLGIAGCTGSPTANEIDPIGELRQGALFTLPDLKGEPVSLEALLSENKAVLINFWATWCPPCREEIPGLIEMQNRYAGEPFTILGVDVGEKGKKVEHFAGQFGMNYPIVLDRDMQVSESYGVFGIPTSFLVTSDRKIIGKYHAYTKKLIRDVEAVMEAGEF